MEYRIKIHVKNSIFLNILIDFEMTSLKVLEKLIFSLPFGISVGWNDVLQDTQVYMGSREENALG